MYCFDVLLFDLMMFGMGYVGVLVVICVIWVVSGDMYIMVLMLFDDDVLVLVVIDVGVDLFLLKLMCGECLL